MKNSQTIMPHIPVIRLLLAFSTILLALSSGASAQDTTRLWARPNVLKTNLLAPVSLFYERALTRRFALRLSARALKLPQGVLNEQAFVNATVEGKIYTARLANLTAKAHPTGFFVNPYLKIRSLRVLDHVGVKPDVFEEETVKSSWLRNDSWLPVGEPEGVRGRNFSGIRGDASRPEPLPSAGKRRYDNDHVNERLPEDGLARRGQFGL